jgi:hypothetical protein
METDLASAAELAWMVLRPVQGAEDPPRPGHGIDMSAAALGSLFDTTGRGDTKIVADLAGAGGLIETTEGRFEPARASEARAVSPSSSLLAEDWKAAVRRLVQHFTLQAWTAVEGIDDGESVGRCTDSDASTRPSRVDPDEWLARERLGVLAAMRCAAEEGTGFSDVVIGLAAPLWKLLRRAERPNDAVLVQTWAWEAVFRAAHPSAATVCGRLASACNAAHDGGYSASCDGRKWAAIALQWAQQSRILAEINRSPADIAAAEAELSGAFARLGRFAEAESAMTAAMSLDFAFTAPGRVLGMRHCDLALMWSHRGLSGPAASVAATAVQHMTADGGPGDLAHALLVRAKVLHVAERQEDARDAAVAALAAGPPPIAEARGRKLLAAIYVQQGDVAEAIAEMDRAQALYVQYGHRREAARVAVMKASTLIGQGR